MKGEKQLSPAFRAEEGGGGEGYNLSDIVDAGFSRKPILVHSCCGPCSTAVVEKLVPEYEVSLFFYNPNITDADEYGLRLAAQHSFVEQYNMLHEGDGRIDLVEGPWEPELFLKRVKGLEGEPEGGVRCKACFALRLEKTAEFAVANGFGHFGTTLSVSPHKDYSAIYETGMRIAGEYGLVWLGDDFKKGDGFQRSVVLAKQYGLYRQAWCGCPFSRKGMPRAAADKGLPVI